MTPWHPTGPQVVELWNECRSTMTRRLRIWKLADAMEIGNQALRDRVKELEYNITELEKLL